MNYSRFRQKRKALAIVAVAALTVAVFLIQYGAVLARAEEGTTTAWAMCRSYINIRMWASKDATAVGFLDPCDPVEVDGTTRDGFAHIVSPVDGWVHAGYLDFSKPEEIGERFVVTARSRVAARRWINGPKVSQKPWLICGSEVTVYYMSEEWALTNRGYVRAEWLEVDPE